MDDKSVDTFVSNVIRKVSGDISNQGETSNSRDENRGDLNKESDNTVVFDKFDDSRKGRKAPRYLLVQPKEASKNPSQTENVNNHHAVVDIHQQTKSDIWGFYAEKDTLHTGEEQVEKEDVVKTENTVEDVVDTEQEESDQENDYLSLRDENEALRRHLHFMQKNHEMEIEIFTQELSELKAAHAQDIRSSYLKGFKFARNGKPSELHEKIERQMATIVEQSDEITILRANLEAYEQEAYEVNQHLLMELKQLKEAYMELAQEQVTGGISLSAVTQRRLFKTHASNTKALSTCVQLQAIINDQRLKLWAFQNHFLKMYNVRQEEENQMLDSAKGTGDSVIKGVSGDKAQRFHSNVSLPKSGLLHPDAILYKDPASIITHNFEIGHSS